jgi:hypothetical protein
MLDSRGHLGQILPCIGSSGTCRLSFEDHFNSLWRPLTDVWSVSGPDHSPVHEGAAT